MKIRITKDVEVDDDVAAKIGMEFMEWLEERGYQLAIKPSYAKLIPEDESYEDLANLWSGTVAVV